MLFLSLLRYQNEHGKLLCLHCACVADLHRVQLSTAQVLNTDKMNVSGGVNQSISVPVTSSHLFMTFNLTFAVFFLHPECSAVDSLMPPCAFEAAMG